MTQIIRDSAVNRITIDNSFVQSVTGLNTDNTDPANPVVRISVDGTTITGDGTPGSPLIGHEFGGTVTNVSVVTANGVSGSVANPTTTPAITLTLGAITPSSVAASGTVTGSNLSGTNTGNQTITLTGDVTGSGTGSFAATLATVNSNVGSFGSSTSIPSFTVNGKGLITAASGNAVVAPAGNLTGTTLASNVVTSSLTALGTISTGIWQATKIGTLYGGTNADSSGSTGVAQVSSGTWSFSTALANGTTGTTQTAGDNSTKIATTAYVNSAVGSAVTSITGTANQILANGTSGSAQTGAITLTLPQDIAAASTPTFGGMTLNGTLTMGANNITSTGSLGATGARLTKGWFTDLEVTNSIVGSITGTAAIATTSTIADESSDTTCFINFTTAATGNLGIKSNAGLLFNSSNKSIGLNGVAPTTGTGKMLQTVSQTDIGASSFGFDNSFTHTTTTTNAFNTVGARLQGFLTAADNYTGSVAGANCNGSVAPATTKSVTLAIGNQGFVQNTGAGTLSEGNCFRAVAPANSGGGTFTTWSGYHAANSTVATNTYGFRGTVASGTTKYNCYMDGTAPNYFAGNVGINALPDANAKLYIYNSNSNTIKVETGAAAGAAGLQCIITGVRTFTFSIRGDADPLGTFNIADDTRGAIIMTADSNGWFGYAGTPEARLHAFERSSTSSTRGVISEQFLNGTTGGSFVGRKARISGSSRITINTGDILADYNSQGYDGTSFVDAGKIRFISTGTIGTGRVPCEVAAYYATDAATSVVTEGWRLNANGLFGIGTSSPAARLHTAGNLSTGTAWGVNGIGVRAAAATYTDTVSSGTVATAVAHGVGIPTFAASSATTFTDAATLYIADRPTAGTNVTVTTGWSLWVDAGNTRLDGTLVLGDKITKYNNINTTGWGTPAIYGTGRSTAQTAAVASVATYTVGAADGSFRVSANVLVTTATLHNFTVTCAYTDEGNTARTMTLPFSVLAGTFVTAITNASGAVPYEGIPVHIRCKASTAITIATTGTFTTVTYNVEGSIEQIA